MTTMAWIYHPGLDRKVRVPASAVGQHAMSGWQECDPPEPEPAAEPETAEQPPVSPGATQTEGAPGRRRRSRKDEQ